MTAKSNVRPQLPAGLSPAEEAEWWDEHRNYWDAIGVQEEPAERLHTQRTKPVNLRLPVGMIDDLKRAAARRALPYQALIRMWLKERLDGERL